MEYNIAQTPKIVSALLATLPIRQRDVLHKRFGLKDGKRRTLEEIGQGYQITRERVRQIENDAKASVLEHELMDELIPFFDFAKTHFGKYGGVRAEHVLFAQDAPLFFPELSRRNLARAYLHFLLALHDAFTKHPETENFHTVWAVDPDVPGSVRASLSDLVSALEDTRELVEKKQLLALFKKFAEDTQREELESHLDISKMIHKNVFGEYGLRHWPEINTRGVRDKAYVVLKKHGKPLHFLEIVDHINEAFSGADMRRAHPQTVHNELIKNDKFVLVGRGMYALSDWGYRPGNVSDVIVRILEDAGKPLGRDAIVQAVLKERDVKPNTIFLNLQNKKQFEKTGEKFILR